MRGSSLFLQSQNKNGMKNSISLLLYLLISQFTLANDLNHAIIGKVVDQSNNPIPFANIYIENSTIGTNSSVDGKFQLSNLSYSKATVVIKSIGYVEKKITVDFSKSRTVELHIKLEEEKIGLNEVVIKADSKASQINKSGFAVTSVDVGVLEARPLELNDVLEQTPGLKVRRDGGLGSRTSFNLNGMTGRAVRIFIDGVPMESFGSSYSVNSIPVSLIERVDVYKGVVPVELGNDALGGAINIITKQMRDTENKNTVNGNASYQLGSFNTHRGDVIANLRNGKTGFTGRVSMFYNYSDNDYKVWSDDIKIRDYNQYLPDGSRNPNYLKIIQQGVKVRRFHDAYESKGVKIDLGITGKSWADQLLYSINLSDDYKELQHGPKMIKPYGERFTESQTIAHSIKYLKKDLIIDNLTFTIDGQYSKSKSSLVDTTTNTYDWLGQIIPPVEGVPIIPGEAGNATLNINDNKNYIVRSSVNYHFNQQHSFGINYSYNEYIRSSDDELQASEIRNHGSTNSITKQIAGVTYQQVLLEERLRNSFFIKYYNNLLEQNLISQNGTEFDTLDFRRPDDNWGYGAASSFELNPKVRINFSIEKAVRLVSTNEVFGNPSDEIDPSTDLKPEKSLNINLGGIIKLFEDGLTNLTLTSNFFLRDTYDRIRRNTIEGREKNSILFTNVGHVNSKGIEAQLDYQIAQKWQFMIQAYYLDSRLMEKKAMDGGPNLNYKSREPNMPYLTSNASASYNIGDIIKQGDIINVAWYASYIYKFDYDWSNIGSQNKPVVPTQFINDLSLSYRFANRRTTLALDARNIFNTMAFDNFAVQKPGASIAAKFSYRF